MTIAYGAGSDRGLPRTGESRHLGSRARGTWRGGWASTNLYNVDDFASYLRSSHLAVAPIRNGSAGRSWNQQDGAAEICMHKTTCIGGDGRTFFRHNRDEGWVSH
jgi:hypothetical protein